MNEWILMQVAAPGSANSNYCEFMVKNEDSISNPPDFVELIGFNPCPGSIAYTNEPGSGAGMDQMFILSMNNTWEEM